MKLKDIEEIISHPVDPQSPDEMLSKLNELVTVSGNLAFIVAESERTYKEALLKNYYELSEQEKKPPSTAYNKVLESMTAKEASWYNYADKLNAALKVTIEGLRSMISLYKSEAENAIR